MFIHRLVKKHTTVIHMTEEEIKKLEEKSDD